jgi:hypothetical protein
MRHTNDDPVPLVEDRKERTMEGNTEAPILISGPSGLRPDLDVAEGQPVAAALAAMIAFDGVARIGPAEPSIGLPSLA